jgi:hypothetical protein
MFMCGTHGVYISYWYITFNWWLGLVFFVGMNLLCFWSGWYLLRQWSVLPTYRNRPMTPSCLYHGGIAFPAKQLFLVVGVMEEVVLTTFSSWLDRVGVKQRNGSVPLIGLFGAKMVRLGVRRVGLIRDWACNFLPFTDLLSPMRKMLDL